MSAPGWTRALLARVADPNRVDEVLGDLDEAHRIRSDRRGRIMAAVLTSLEAVDMAYALWRLRGRSVRTLRRTVPPDFRAALRRRMPPVSWLDFKLGLRMMVKHPGLSLVSTLGITVAVTIGTGAFGVIRGMTASPLPLHEGDRVLTIQNTSGMGFEQVRRTHLHDVDTWRDELTSLEDLGAYRIVTRNLIGADGAVAPARVVQMTASGFRIARVPPLLGRHLVEDDERSGAPDVIVIGWGIWQDRFGGDPAAVGRSLQVGATPHTIIGVMPRDFAFPINNRIWIPLRLDPDDYALGQAPEIDVFARLAPRATTSELSAQLSVVSQRAAAVSPETHGGLRARAYPYTQEMVWGPLAWLLYVAQVLVSMILVVIAINVAALVYARTVARSGEIAVRTALGASRARIASQLFAEAFLLSGLAAGAGLLVARYGLHRFELWQRDGSGEEMPFWWHFDVSSAGVAYTFGLAVVAALIMGVAPALGATGQHLRGRLQGAGSGASGPGLGRVWTTLIVLQLAGAVAILPVTLSGVAGWVRAANASESAFPLDEVLTARLELDADERRVGIGDAPDPSAGRYGMLRDELVRRLEAHPQVSHTALLGDPPTWLDPDVSFELDEGPTVPLREVAIESAATGHRVGRSAVSPELFATFDIPVLAGRALDARDVTNEPSTVVVNQTFVDLVMGGGSPLGRQIRFPRREDPRLGSGSPLTTDGVPWYTIVGVIPDFPAPARAIGRAEAKAYLPLAVTGDEVVSLAVRVRGGDASGFAGRLRQMTAEIDPMLRLASLGTLESGGSPDQRSISLILPIVALALSVLLLAVAGLYAMMSFTVSRRHREIGIRTALGAGPHRVLGSILARAAWQLTLGVAVGLAFADVADRLAGGEMLAGRETLLLPGVAALMVLVGVLAAWGPARRALDVQPTEALRAE
jgi:predicted permease